MGEAIAWRLAQEGCRGLTLSDVQTERLTQVARAIQETYPYCRTLAQPCDVRSEAEVAETVYGIRVNAIRPGNLFESAMWQETLFEQYAHKWGIPQAVVQCYYEAQVPLGRGCTYADVCNLLVFLASDSAAYITGESYRVAGGQL